MDILCLHSLSTTMLSLTLPELYKLKQTVLPKSHHPENTDQLKL